MIHGNLNTTIYWGCIWQHVATARSVDSLGQEFLDFLDQASWCHAGTAWIFVAAHAVAWDVTGIGAWGIPCEQLVWQGQLEPVFIRVASVAWCSRMWAACAGAGCGGNAGCAAEKQCLVGACSVAVVPLGTVLTALTLHSQRCLHMCAVVCGTIAGVYT